MGSLKAVESRARDCLASFLVKSSIPDIKISEKTDLIKEANLTSLQGLEFVLDLCDEFQFEFPVDFNPFVDDQRRRSQTFEGMVKAIKRHLASQGESNVKE